jgi:hypothetical protein
MGEEEGGEDVESRESSDSVSDHTDNSDSCDEDYVDRYLELPVMIHDSE